MNIEPMDSIKSVLKAIIKGKIVPFLGAGVNLCGRPVNVKWQKDQSRYLPNGNELADHLADEYDYPCNELKDLLRVTQYIELMNGSGPLYEELHDLFAREYFPTPVHRFLATLPAILRQKGYSPPYQLIVTTNYDDVLEAAFKKAKEPYDLVYYVAVGDKRGKFLHWSPDGDVRLIEKPNEYTGLSLEQRTVILKIHGAVNRSQKDKDSFVITEDDYIDYLTRTDISNLIPVKLLAKLCRSHFLFMGYSLRDWNLRVILHRIWAEQPLTYNSWAILLNPDKLDQKFWENRGEKISILDVDLEHYIAELSNAINALSPAGAS